MKILDTACLVVCIISTAIGIINENIFGIIFGIIGIVVSLIEINTK